MPSLSPWMTSSGVSFLRIRLRFGKRLPGRIYCAGEWTAKVEVKGEIRTRAAGRYLSTNQTEGPLVRLQHDNVDRLILAVFGRLQP